MGLNEVLPMDEVEKEIGEERAKVVRRFRELAWGRDKVEETVNYYNGAVEKYPHARSDLKVYVHVHLKTLSFALSGF